MNSGLCMSLPLAFSTNLMSASWQVNGLKRIIILPYTKISSLSIYCPQIPYRKKNKQDENLGVILDCFCPLICIFLLPIQLIHQRMPLALPLKDVSYLNVVLPPYHPHPCLVQTAITAAVLLQELSTCRLGPPPSVVQSPHHSFCKHELPKV